jgi:hypothetical protein
LKPCCLKQFWLQSQLQALWHPSQGTPQANVWPNDLPREMLNRTNCANLH